MPLFEKTTPANLESQASDGAVSKMLDDSYNRMSKTIEKHPTETVLGVAGTMAVAAAALIITRGRSATGMVEAAAERAAVLPSATPDLVGALKMTYRTAPAESLAPARGIWSGASMGSSEPLRYTGFNFRPMSIHKASATGATTSDRLVADLSAGSGASNRFATLEQGQFKFIPSTTMAEHIRAAEGPTFRPIDGPSRIVFGEDNSVQHILYNRQASPQEQASLLMRAGYAELIKTDALAAEAAGKVEGKSIGFISNPVERHATQEEMQHNATEGARAYVEMNTRGANQFTHYLTERFGPMTRESQSWEIHTLTDSASPESGWNWRMRPATETLIQNGLPITPLHRAVAANPSVLISKSELRASAINGGAEYMRAQAEQALPQGATDLAKNAWYGQHAAAMPPELVSTVGSLTQTLGAKACADTSTIDAVARMVGAHGKPEDYVGAYKALKEAPAIIARLDGSASAEVASLTSHPVASIAAAQEGGAIPMTQAVIRDLRAAGMPWNHIFDATKSGDDPTAFRLLETAVASRARHIPVESVAIAAKLVGPNKVSLEDVTVIEKMLNSDSQWTAGNISHSDFLTAQTIIKSQADGRGLDPVLALSKDAIDAIKRDPRFVPRPAHTTSH